MLKHMHKQVLIGGFSSANENTRVDHVTVLTVLTRD